MKLKLHKLCRRRVKKNTRRLTKGFMFNIILYGSRNRLLGIKGLSYMVRSVNIKKLGRRKLKYFHNGHIFRKRFIKNRPHRKGTNADDVR